MKRIETTELLFSSLFFLFAIFTLLIVGLSHYTHSFSQLFALVNSEQGIYALIFDILTISGLLLSLFFIFFRKKSRTLPIKYKLSMWLTSLFFAALIALDSAYGGSILVKIEELSGVSINIILHLLNVLFFGAFVFLPLIVWLREMEFDRSDSLGRYFHALRPSPNIAICTIFMLSIQPIIKDSIIGYLELGILWLGLAMILLLWARKRKFFGFYESFNLLLLIASVILMSLSYELFSTEYHSMKMTFYMLILVGWSARWCERITHSH
ncbi:MAG: hypothetical protein ACTTJS_04030 [Wolinella sp.]